ncbi:MAG: exopolysaccharide Pel transporter PelG [Candidatus Omnitrophica bacterium]|nr:exopolysaccharide Pel transporter PelG [Candidatus Omnitrophota bacterium]
MAGIGFRLQKILQKDTYIDTIKAYFYSALIFSGPWILSIFSLFALGYFNPKSIDTYELVFFKTTIVYIFAFSLIFAGVLYVSLNRYISDKLYLKEAEMVVPILNSVTLLVLVCQFAAGWLFFHFQGERAYLCFISALVYAVISMVWVLLIFLSALRDYRIIAAIYFLGSAVTVGAALFLGNIFGLEGYFTGYFLGHFLIVVLFASRVFIEFPSNKIFDSDFFAFLFKNKTLVFTGVLYNMAIWIDKIIFWFSPKALIVRPCLRTMPIYDSSVFLAYLTIIPALSIFVVEVETDFYLKYRDFYSAVLEKAPYSSIKRAKTRMSESLRRSLTFVIITQGVISLLAVTFAPWIVNSAGLEPEQIPIFRITTLGAYVHSLVLILFLIISYFDFQRLALAVALTFVLSNAVFTYCTLNMAVPFWGYGYFFSALLTLAYAFYTFDFKYKRLEYITFALQPIAGHREEEG